jgi:hypothetical protein
MRFPAGPVSGVAFVKVGLIENLEAQRRKGLGQFLRNGGPDAHERSLNGGFTIL